MRCKLCDYDETGLPSEYNDGIEDKRERRRVRYNATTGDAICTHCISEIRDTNIEWEEEGEEGHFSKEEQQSRETDYGSFSY